jgi:hypothetical protein
MKLCFAPALEPELSPAQAHCARIAGRSGRDQQSPRDEQPSRGQPSPLLVSVRSERAAPAWLARSITVIAVKPPARSIGACSSKKPPADFAWTPLPGSNSPFRIVFPLA